MKYLLIILLFWHQTVFAQKSPGVFSDHISSTISSLSLVMMHDVVNPPAAARYYAYCMLGAYEIVSQNNTSVPALSKLLSDYKSISINTKNKYNSEAAALYCMLETGRLMLPSGESLSDDQEKLLGFLHQYIKDTALLNNSVAVAKKVAGEVVGFSKKDHYNQLSAKMRYRPIRDDAHWYPTPPAYIEAVEPNWRTVKTMVIDSCNEFPPKPATVFSKDTSSHFYKLAKEVYDVSQKPTEEQVNQAAFWDCNPFAVATSGHMSIGFKKISPGGHWMNIGCIVANKAKLNFDQAIVMETVLSVTLMDAFISSWDEKYRSNRIRPETYINRYINARWQPLLQTPPFPEYPSAHSVISTASAEVLTYFLGDNFSYTDDSERMFELPARSFKSFRQAADEAAISRMYGGIHFRDAVENGQQQGLAVSKRIISQAKQAGLKKIFK